MISIIIVSYNTKKFLLPCLASIKKFAPKDKEVIVIDNNSTDGSVEKLQKQDIQLIENKENLGFAKAVNIGIREARGEYLFILNPDTKVTKDAIQKMVEFIKDGNNVGIAAPRLLNLDGSIQPSCYHEPTIWAAIKEYFFNIMEAFNKYAPSGNKPVKVDAVVGAAMLISRGTVERVGLLGEKFFMYFEDLDYCRRVRKEKLAIYYLPEAQIYHVHGGVTSTVKEMANRWLIESSKLYHGLISYTLLSLILKLGQKWQKSFS
ncbi:glycosyltransferase family 2 protein [Candidatus Microgenomates bacterium]|nr:glycosyltransferase family 2 protein [Candidatus Microgenomates bacterium]